MIALAPDPIDPAALLESFTASVEGAGAIVSFTGLVRADDGVEGLWLDHHERLTVAAMEELEAETRRRFATLELSIVHRIGSLVPAQPILFLAAAAVHRRAAFDAVDFAMDRLKTDIPLWKREDRGGERRWIEARGADRVDAARWEQVRD